MKILHFLLFVFFSHIFFGQSTNWKFFDRLKVQNSDGLLKNPWSGSLNNAQINSIDLNFDGLEDFWIFDRVAQRSLVFRQENNQWVYDYDLTKKLPSIQDWLLVEDYDGDGKKDVFTSALGGIRVLKNSSESNNLKFTVVTNQLMEQGFSGMINLYVSPTDIPLIKDIDADGDLDILAFESAGHTIEWHENTSMDVKKMKGLDFKKNSGCWGNIVVQDCASIFLNQGCQLPTPQTISKPTLINKVLHTGNTLAGVYQNQKLQIWMGHVGCPNVAVLKNEGSVVSPYFSSVMNAFPIERPISVPFPAVFFVDTNFDGVQEAIITPNSSDNLGYEMDFKNSVLRMEPLKGSFELKESNFLQNTTLDVGENASPLFTDLDGDSDLDLLVGNAMGDLYFYENKDETLVFQTKNFGNISTQNPGKELKLAHHRFEGKEMVLAISQIGTTPKIMGYQKNEKQWNVLSQVGLIAYDQVFFQDIDFDGQAECLVLHRSGRVDVVDMKLNGSSIEFKLLKEDFGGLISQRFILQTFTLVDERGEGQLSLMGIDREGQFRKAKLINGMFEFVEIDPEFSPIFGRNTGLQAIDFSKDGKTDLVVGTSGGGIQLFENKNQSSIFESSGGLIQTWPNPSNGSFFVRSNESGLIQIVDLSGKSIQEVRVILSNETLQISLESKEEGVYFLRFDSEKGRSEVKKLLISN